MSELNIVLKYKGFNEKFESLKEVKLLNLPNEIDEFVNRVEKVNLVTTVGNWITGGRWKMIMPSLI